MALDLTLALVLPLVLALALVLPLVLALAPVLPLTLVLAPVLGAHLAPVLGVHLAPVLGAHLVDSVSGIGSKRWLSRERSTACAPGDKGGVRGVRGGERGGGVDRGGWGGCYIGC